MIEIVDAHYPGQDAAFTGFGRQTTRLGKALASVCCGASHRMQIPQWLHVQQNLIEVWAVCIHKRTGQKRMCKIGKSTWQEKSGNQYLRNERVQGIVEYKHKRA